MLQLFDPARYETRGAVAPMEAPSSHEPVLLEEITRLLAVADGPGIVVDATLGMGGHAVSLLASSATDVALVGFDRDPAALELAERRLAAFRGRVHLLHAPYDELTERVAPLTAELGPVRAVLYDLGVSSLQLDRGERGFSFQHDAPLDMRMDPTTGGTAADLCNTAAVDDLRDILRTYGEERHATRIARAIVAARPLRTTGELAEVVTGALPAAARRGPRHPATRTFQALRIAVNDELDELERALEAAERVLAPGGRLAVVAFHSLEDRIVKRFLGERSGRTRGTSRHRPPGGSEGAPTFRLVTGRPLRPGAREVAANPRARSARLRVAERLMPAADAA